MHETGQGFSERQNGAMTDPIDNRVLYALFCLSRATLPIDTTAIAEAAGLSTMAAGQALLRLEKAGLVDASRARLTMLGLAKAAALSPDLSGTAPGPAQQRPRAVQQETLPVAANPAERSAH
jgi:hypothetical protein